jgi:CRISPR-associated protein Csb2
MAVNGKYGKLNDGANSPCFTGKTDGEVRREQHRHAFFLPDTSSVHEGEDKLDRLIIYSPEGFSNEELGTLKVMRDMPDLRRRRPGKYDSGERFKLVPIELLGKEEGPQVFGESDTWVSWTPFLCPRYLKASGKNSASGQVRAECEVRGLPEVVEVTPFELHLQGKSGAWSDFARWRWREEKSGRKTPLGFRIRFSEPVAGPLALGASCHFGMGRFRPEDG